MELHRLLLFGMVRNVKNFCIYFYESTFQDWPIRNCSIDSRKDLSHSYAAQFCLAHCRSSKGVIEDGKICSVVVRKGGLVLRSRLAISALLRGASSVFAENLNTLQWIVVCKTSIKEHSFPRWMGRQLEGNHSTPNHPYIHFNIPTIILNILYL